MGVVGSGNVGWKVGEGWDQDCVGVWKPWGEVRLSMGSAHRRKAVQGCLGRALSHAMSFSGHELWACTTGLWPVQLKNSKVCIILIKL